jgi:hypothetical protein
VGTDRRHQRVELAPQQRLAAGDLVGPELPDARRAAHLAAGLELRDVRGDLLDHGEAKNFCGLVLIIFL